MAVLRDVFPEAKSMSVVHSANSYSNTPAWIAWTNVVPDWIRPSYWRLARSSMTSAGFNWLLSFRRGLNLTSGTPNEAYFDVGIFPKYTNINTRRGRVTEWSGRRLQIRIRNLCWAVFVLKNSLQAIGLVSNGPDTFKCSCHPLHGRLPTQLIGVLYRPFIGQFVSL